MEEPRAGGMDGVLAMKDLMKVAFGIFIGLMLCPRIVLWLQSAGEPNYWGDLHRAVAVVVAEHEKSQGPQEWWTFTCSGSLQSHTYCVVDAGYNRPGGLP